MTTPTTALTPEQLQARLNRPAGTPPAGVVPNLENPPNLNAFVILTLTLAMTFGTLVVIMRIYTKAFLIRNLAYEDYAVMLGWAIQFAMVVPWVITIRHGGGSHIWNIQLGTFIDMVYWTEIASILYFPVVFFVKLSILLQYLRLFVPNRKGNMSLFVAIQFCIWSCFTMYLLATIFAIVIRVSPKDIWHPSTTWSHYINDNGVYLSATIFNVISDSTILILPMPSLWKLQMPVKRKIVTTAIFATGFLVCVTSTLRTYYAWQIIKRRDVSYNVVKVLLWTYAEIAIGTIVSCIPVLPRFFRHFSPKLYAKFASNSKPGSGNPRPTSQSPVAMEKPRNSATLSSKKPFTNGSGGGTNVLGIWNKAYHPSAAEVKGEYVTLDGYDAALPTDGAASELVPKVAKGIATRRDDLESGLDNPRSARP